jgi:predicted acyltransferase
MVMTVTEASPAPSRLSDPKPLPEIVVDRTTKPARLESLDIFRGITIAAMLLVNNPGSWSNVYAPLGHASWHGWTPTDLIFPFFLFIVGVAIPFSLAKRSSTGEKSRKQLLGGIWGRALSLVLLGLLLAAIPSARDALPDGYGLLKAVRVAGYGVVWITFVALLFPWKSPRLAMGVPLLVALVLLLLYWSMVFACRHALGAGLPENFAFGGGILTPWRMRFPGVLQRIGVCYGVAATIALFAGWRTILASAIGFMAIYAALMLSVPFDGHVTGALEKNDNLARHVDVAVFGQSPARNHNYSYPDPEGLLSTLPAIASVLFGILIGLCLRSDRPAPKKASITLGWGVAVTCVGLAMGWWLMPINKQVWTPSFTVFTAGMAMLGLGAVFYVADVRGHRRWALPFKIYGMNAIAAFVLAGILGRVSATIAFKHPRTGDDTHPLAYAKDAIGDGVHHAAAWLAQHVGPAWQVVDAPNNLSLAWAIAFVLFVLVVMSVLYTCRIFIKV